MQYIYSFLFGAGFMVILLAMFNIVPSKSEGTDIERQILEAQRKWQKENGR